MKLNYLSLGSMKLNYLSLFKIAFVLCASFITNAFAADYDGDKKDDLETVRVSRSRSNQNAGTTRWSVRLSSTGRIRTYNFSLPGAALVRLKGSDRKYYPGIVWVRDMNSPLEWTIKTRRGQKRVKFGLPGDIIPNQADLDRDGVDDYTIVRKKEDGALEWFTYFSKTKTTRSTIFGTVDQKPFLGADGMLLVVSPAFLWTGKYFDDNTHRFSVTWGQTGDIPMAPVLTNQLVVTRPGRRTKLYSLHSNSPQIVTLGSKTTIPTMGNLTSKNLTFGWHDRSKGRVYLRNTRKRRYEPVTFGDSRSAIVLPSGQVIQPGTTGAFTPAPTPTPTPRPTASPTSTPNGGNNPPPNYTPTNPGLSAVCPSVRSARGGEIWKSIASTHIPNSDPRRFSTSFITKAGTQAPSFTCLQMYDGKGNLIHQLGRYYPTGSSYSSRSYGGSGCGDKRTAHSVAQAAANNTGSTTGYLKVNNNECVQIPNPNSCLNSSAC